MRVWLWAGHVSLCESECQCMCVCKHTSCLCLVCVCVCMVGMWRCLRSGSQCSETSYSSRHMPWVWTNQDKERAVCTLLQGWREGWGWVLGSFSQLMRKGFPERE